MKRIIFLIIIIFLVSGCAVIKNSDNFEKRKICYDDAKGNEFVFYSPKFDACVDYFCIYYKADPEIFDMKISPGCEIMDFYSDKLYKAIGCANEEECSNKLEKYK